MEFLVSFISIIFGVGLLFCGITIILNLLCMVISVLYLVIKFFFELFSRPKYPNCAKAMAKKIIKCPNLVIKFFFELFSRPKCPNCAKAIRKMAIRCPHCESSLTEETPQQEMNLELYARVKVLIAEQTWVLEELTPDTHLADDLAIVGDEGYELLEAFCEEFEIRNISEIDPYEYFGPERWNPFYIYVLFYYLAFKKEKLKDTFSLTPLYLRDLVKSAEAKRWILLERAS